MCTCYCDAALHAHEFGEHEGTRNHRQFLRARRDHFWVRRIDGGRHHYGLRVLQVFCLMAYDHTYTERRQSLQRWRVCGIATADLVTLIVQNLGNTTHADATDADEMQIL